MPDYAGQQIGSYQLTRLLGQGGFATVYLGEHLYLKKQAAVKLLQVRINSQDLQNFLKEAQIIAKLEHPHVINIFDFGIDSTSSQPFFVMEYASGGSLRRIHPRGSILSLRTVVSYVQQVASALSYAHAQKIVHCDVKPENMLVASTNKVVLSDFGIAVTAHTTESISKQNVTGTALYMAPEQIRGKARPASDQYALGVVVYEWLCGVCPFEKATSIATMMSHIMDSPPPLRKKIPSIPQEVEDIVLQALAKEPQQRFADVNEFALALENAHLRSTQTRLKRTHIVSYKTQPLPPAVTESKFPTEPSERTETEPFTLAKPTHVEPSATPKVPQDEFPFSSPAPDPRTIMIRQAQENPEQTPALSAKIISRRALVIGAATLAALGLGGIAWSKLTSLPVQSKGAASTSDQGKALLVYTGHAASVWAIGWSPDGTQIASGSDDQTVQIWDSITGTKFLAYEGHVPLPNSKTINHQGSFVETLAWSPDGQWIASGGKEASVHVWSSTTGQRLYAYPHKDLVGTVAWSKDGRWLASGGWEGTIHICEALTGKRRRILTGHTHNLSSVDWSKDGSLLISGNVDNTVRVWDTSNGNTLYVYRHSGAVKRVEWSPDNKKIASGGDDKQIHIWDFVRKNTILIYDKHTGPVKSLAWSPDGKLIASAGDDHTVQIWDASNGNTLFTYKGHLQTATVKSAIWSLDGKKIASASYDQTVRIWKAL